MALGVGIGLRAAHYHALLEERPRVAWFEVHAENYFGEAGPHWEVLDRVRCDYPVSVHGVGLSLGSTDPLSVAHLRRLKAVVERVDAALVSEHLSWSAVGGRHFNQLLPLPYTEEALDLVVERLTQVQDTLGRPILIENVSRYLDFEESRIPEPEFLVAVARRTDCRLLLDVNNVFVTATNLGWDAEAYLDSLPATLIGEVHLAGFVVHKAERGEVLIDSHSRPVAEPVWRLFRRLVARIGAVPTLVEWDADLPPLGELLQEAEKARCALEDARAVAA